MEVRGTIKTDHHHSDLADSTTNNTMASQASQELDDSAAADPTRKARGRYPRPSTAPYRVCRTHRRASTSPRRRPLPTGTATTNNDPL